MPQIRINGVQHDIAADPQMPLLWAIRDILGMPGTKFGCGIGACGACTVHMDGNAVRSCITGGSCTSWLARKRAMIPTALQNLNARQVVLQAASPVRAKVSGRIPI